MLLSCHGPLSGNIFQHPWEKEKRLLKVSCGQDFIIYIQNSLVKLVTWPQPNHKSSKSTIVLYHVPKLEET